MNLKTLQSLILLAAVGGFLGGCTSLESMRDTVRDRVAGVPPKVRVIDGESHQSYEAARRAMEKQGYRFASGGPAQGRLEGLTRIDGGRDFGSSRQRSISIHLEPLDGGKIEVQVLLTEIAEEDSNRAAGAPVETPLRESAGYDAFFAELERQLQSSISK
jgi:hypothetical protein